MKVRVCIRDKQIDIQCGEGPQNIMWLANVAISRHDSNEGVMLGRPLGVRLENGTQLPMDGIICDLLKDGAQVFVMLKGGDEIIELKDN